MNFNFAKFISSSFRLMIAIFFMFAGIAGILLPWVAVIRTQLVAFIVENSLGVFLFGMGFFATGLGIAVKTIQAAKHWQYRIKSKSMHVAIDSSLIQNYLNTYWTELFPQHKIPNEISLKNNQIHISANLPHLPLTDQKILLQKIEKELGQLFGNILGYNREFYLSLSFENR